MIFIDNKYTKWYYSIINTARLRNLPKRRGDENHHIIPECFYINRKRKGPSGWLEGNPESKENKVILTNREHFICHWLLTKMTDGKAKSSMIFSLNGMKRKNKNQERYETKITSRVYARIKLDYVEIARQMNTGRKMSAESSTAKSLATKGKPKSEEWKKKNRKPKSEQGRLNMQGRINSPEQLAKQSATTTGVSKSEKHKQNMRKPKSTTINMKKPKVKIICRLTDRKEMTRSNFVQWEKIFLTQINKLHEYI